MCFYEYINESLNILINDNIYVYNILRYCDFYINFDILFRLSHQKLFDNKQFVDTKIIDFANYFELICIDFII